MKESQPYETNLRELIKSNGYTFKEVAEETGIVLRTLFDYASGKVSIPHGYRVQIAKVLGCEVTDLISRKRSQQGTSKKISAVEEQIHFSQPLADDTIQANDLKPTVSPNTEGSTVPIPDTGLRPLYALAEQQLTTLTSLVRLGEAIMFDPTKRQTLETLLAALSVALVKPQGLLQAEAWKPLLLPTTDVVKASPETMQGLHSLIETCWQLSRGTELPLAEKLLPECMSRLVPLAQQPSPYQQEAINLTAQGFRLSSIFAFHRNDMQAKEMYGKQAVQYGRLSEDQGLLISSLKGLGGTYYYRGQYPQALQVYYEALQHIKSVSPLQQASIYMSLAGAYAHMGQHQDALMYLGLAHDTFPDHPETDPSFAYAEFDLSQMVLWEGITRSQLGQSQQALDILSRIEQPDFSASKRLRVQIINQRAKTAIFAGDLEQGATYVEAGIMGAKALGSQRRYSEAYENYQQMCLLWPQEQRVTALGELLH